MYFWDCWWSCLCHRSMYERDSSVGEQHQPHLEEPRGGAGCRGVREGCWLRPLPRTPSTPLRLLPLAASRPVAGPGASHAASALAGAQGLWLTRWHDAPAHRSVFILITHCAVVPSLTLNISISSKKKYNFKNIFFILMFKSENYKSSIKKLFCTTILIIILMELNIVLLSLLFCVTVYVFCTMS